MRLSRYMPIIGILIFIAILSSFELSEIGVTLQRADMVFIALSIAIQAAALLVKGLKWNVILRVFRKKFSFSESLASWIFGFFVGVLTPGRVGDISRAYYIRKKLPVGKSISAVFFDRFIDIIILFMLAFLGLVGFSLLFAYNEWFIVYFAFLLVVFPISAVTIKKNYMLFLIGRFSKIFPGFYNTWAGTAANNFISGLNRLVTNKRLVVTTSMLTLVSFFLTLTQYYFLSISLAINMTFLQTIMILPIVMVMDMLPITIFGLGTREATLILFFSAIGISTNLALAYSLSLLFFAYLPITFVGFVVWLANPGIN